MPAAPPPPVSWTGKAIAHLSLHRPAETYTRLDVLPFVLLYGSMSTAIYVLEVSRFVGAVLLTTCVMLHILAFLVQHWSVKAKAFVSWARVRSVDPVEVAEGNVHALVQPREHRGKAEMVQLHLDYGDRVHFNFQKRTYELNPQTNTFEKVMYPTKLPVMHYMNAVKKMNGLSGENLLHTVVRFGSNKLEMPAPSFMELYIESLLAPFFVFQVFCIFLWLLDEYWKTSLVTLGMMLLFEATVVFGRLRSLKELRGMRNPSLTINAYRNGKWAPISSLELLPGDIVSICRGRDSSHVVPCDLLILSGSAVVNEAMLTGESVPLMKEAVTQVQESEENEPLSIKGKHKNHILFGGTRILTHTPAAVSSSTPSAKTPDNGCICYVLRTGFGSSQGKLMRTILFSTESVSANSSEAAIFILFLLVFAIAASSYVLYYRYSDDANDRYKLLLRCVLIITSVVPPELPMQLALAVNTSLVALVKNWVFCTEPYRIPYAGKIDICCFDKTGTITSDSINATGVALPEAPSQAREERSPQSLYPLIPVADSSTNAALVLAACHSLVYVDNELIGDPLELAALQSVQWTYGRSGSCVPKRGGASAVTGNIVQRYRFSSALQRMSVIAVVSGSATRNGPRVLVKGSPEAIGRLLKDQVLPTGYQETARKFARGGMRVLALAQKLLPSDMKVSELKRVSREEAESELTFVGFVCFECPLRSDSRKVVRVLRQSNHLVTMITGDATLTAAHVATQVEMCTKSVLILDKSEVDIGTLEWFSANSGKRKKRFRVDTIGELAKEFDLCVSGPALRVALDLDLGFKSMLKYIKVFARMSPDQKENVITSLKEEGLHALMCGDGTNDVGALKQAHVGVALLAGSSVRAQPPLKGHDSSTKSRAGDVDGDQSGSSSASRKGSNLRHRNKSKPGQGQESSAGVVKEKAGRAKAGRGTHQEAYAKKMEELTASLGDSEDQPPLVKLGDASIASPFTSRRMTIDSCVSIIRQGRCTLATTLQMYQILALNCLISAYSLSVLHLKGVMFGDKQMMITNLVLAVASFMVSRSKPSKKLSPHKPAATVFAPGLFISLMGQFGVHVAALIACMRFVEPYLPEDYSPDIDAEFKPSILNTVVFLLHIAQQISVYVLNYKGRPYMQSIFDNKLLLNSILAAAGILAICTLEVSTDLNEQMELVSWPSADLQMKIACVIIFDLVAAFVIDRTAKLLFSSRAKPVE